MVGEQVNQGHRLAVVISVLISVVILVVLALRMDWVVLGEKFGEVRWVYVPLLVAVSLLTYWVRALRWRHLLPESSGLRRGVLFEATLVGFAATFILPFRMGEFVRPLVLRRWQSVRFSEGLASVVVERVFDALTLMGLLGLSLSQIESMPPVVTAGAKVLAVLALMIMAVMMAAYLWSAWIARVGEGMIMKVLGKNFPSLAKKLVGIAEGFLAGLRGISSIKDLAWAVMWSVILWALFVALYQIGLWTFGLAPSWWVGAVVCVMIALAIAAPAAPGFVGTFQLGCVIAFSIFGYSEESAVAYSIVLHALQMITVVVCGFIVLNRRSLKINDITDSYSGNTPESSPSRSQ